MSILGDQFKIDLSELKANNMAVKQGKKYRFTVLTERLIRLEYSETGVFNDHATQLVTKRNFPVPEFTVKEDLNYMELETSYFKLSYVKEAFFKGTNLNTLKNLKVDLKGTSNIWHYDHPEARNYFGSNMTLNDLNASKKINRGMFSLEGFVSLDDSDNLKFDETGTIVTDTPKNVDIYLFMYNKDFGFCISDYFQLTGMPSFIPRYVLGNWWCRNLPYTDEQVLEVANNFEKHHIPLSVFLLDNEWHVINKHTKGISATGYTFNKELIKEPRNLMNELHRKGIRIGLNINPKDGIYPGEENYAKVSEYLELQDAGIIKFEPLNPKFIAAYLNLLIRPLEEAGTDFFWNDYDNTEDLKGLWLMNHYHYKDLARNPAKRGMILSRNGMVAAHRYPVLYSGQTKVSWENFKSIPFFNLSASNIGVCWWSHDIGGYAGGIEDPELYLRSVQLGTFSPILRFHSTKGKYYKREPWRWDTSTSDIAGAYLRLRHRLTSYLYAESYKYYKTGTMIFQPLYYFLPKVYDDLLYRNEYFFGSELLIAPIVNKKETIMNRTIHRFYLPDGIWYDFTTGKKFVGNRKYVSFYKDQDYPVFAKRGAIIPLSNRSNINNTSNPIDLEIHIFPGENNTYKLYEDDGISSLYKEGFYIITEIDYNYLPSNFTVIIRSIEGKSGIIPDNRNYKIRFRNTKQAESVTAYIDETPLETRSYVEDTDFIVEVPNARTIGQLTINCRGRDIEFDSVRLVNDDIDEILSDLQIETTIKEKIGDILFSNLKIEKKRVALRKLKKDNLDKSFIKLFIKLLEYIEII
jgi:Alpha-glucosidases, family 31 of glycosyl hydrolases